MSLYPGLLLHLPERDFLTGPKAYRHNSSWFDVDYLRRIFLPKQGACLPMEKADRELLLSRVTTDERLKELYKEHLRLEKEVSRLSLYSSYSPVTAFRERMLKKEKLRGMDRIMSILRDYKKSEMELLSA